MPTLNDALRTSAIADIVSNLNRLELLDGATTIDDITITWAAGAAGEQDLQSTPIAGTAEATGTIDGAVLHKDDDTPDERVTCTVGLTSSGADIELSGLEIETIGQAISITGGTLTMPAS